MNMQYLSSDLDVWFLLSQFCSFPHMHLVHFVRLFIYLFFFFLMPMSMVVCFFFISNCNYSFLAYRKEIDFHILTLYLVTLPQSLVNSRRFFAVAVDSLGFSTICYFLRTQITFLVIRTMTIIIMVVNILKYMVWYARCPSVCITSFNLTTT